MTTARLCVLTLFLVLSPLAHGQMNPTGPSRTRKIVFYSLAGVGAALTIVSAVGLGIYAHDHNRCLDPACGMRIDNTTGIALSATGLVLGAIATPVFIILANKPPRVSFAQLKGSTLGTVGLVF